MQNKTLPGLSLCLGSLLLSGVALGATPPQGDPSGQTPLVIQQEPPEWQDRREMGGTAESGFQSDEVRRILTDLSPNASADEVEFALADLLPQIYRATGDDMAMVGEIIDGLRRQPGAVEAIARHYERIPAEALEQRLVVIGILGEMQRPEAISQLGEVVWAPLPAADGLAEGLGSRDFEEMVQAKAVQGLAYLRTPEADRAVLDVIADHEALHVRISAIDAYMWNHDDSRAAARQLYELLPKELHPYVERPRFHQGMSTEEFNKRLDEWRQRWQPASPNPLPAEPEGSAR